MNSTNFNSSDEEIAQLKIKIITLQDYIESSKLQVDKLNRENFLLQEDVNHWKLKIAETKEHVRQFESDRHSEEVTRIRLQHSEIADSLVTIYVNDALGVVQDSNRHKLTFESGRKSRLSKIKRQFGVGGDEEPRNAVQRAARMYMNMEADNAKHEHQRKQKQWQNEELYRTKLRHLNERRMNNRIQRENLQKTITDQQINHSNNQYISPPPPQYAQFPMMNDLGNQQFQQAVMYQNRNMYPNQLQNNFQPMEPLQQPIMYQNRNMPLNQLPYQQDTFQPMDLNSQPMMGQNIQPNAMYPQPMQRFQQQPPQQVQRYSIQSSSESSQITTPQTPQAPVSQNSAQPMNQQMSQSQQHLQTPMGQNSAQTTQQFPQHSQAPMLQTSNQPAQQPQQPILNRANIQPTNIPPRPQPSKTPMVHNRIQSSSESSRTPTPRPQQTPVVQNSYQPVPPRQLPTFNRANIQSTMPQLSKTPAVQNSTQSSSSSSQSSRSPTPKPQQTQVVQNSAQQPSKNSASAEATSSTPNPVETVNKSSPKTWRNIEDDIYKLFVINNIDVIRFD